VCVNFLLYYIQMHFMFLISVFQIDLFVGFYNGNRGSSDLERMKLASFRFFL
jgi:hypothetical protein